MQTTFEKISPTEKELLSVVKEDSKTLKKEIRKEEVHDENDLSLILTSAMADLIIQQNLS